MLLAAVVAVLLLPASASAARVVEDRAGGYKLSVNARSLQVTLTIPKAQVGGKQSAYAIACKEEGSGLIGFIELDPTRKLRGPGSYFPRGDRVCTLDKDGKRAAKFRLR